MGIVACVVLIAVLILAFLAVQDIRTLKDADLRAFVGHGEELVVTESRYEPFRNEEADHVRVVGSIQNSGEETWTGFMVEVAFLDKEGELLGVVRRWKHQDVLKPGASTDFHVERSISFDPERVGSHRVRITSASVS